MPITLTPGTNTYATLTEVTNFFSESPMKKYWDLITDDEDKKRYLISAYKRIKVLESKMIDEPLSTDLHATTWAIEVQAREALGEYFVLSDTDYQSRLALQQQGITQLEIDKLKEVYGKRKRYAGLYSEDAFRILRDYLSLTATKVFDSL